MRYAVVTRLTCANGHKLHLGCRGCEAQLASMDVRSSMVRIPRSRQRICCQRVSRLLCSGPSGEPRGTLGEQKDREGSRRTQQGRYVTSHLTC